MDGKKSPARECPRKGTPGGPRLGQAGLLLRCASGRMPLAAGAAWRSLRKEGGSDSFTISWGRSHVCVCGFLQYPTAMATVTLWHYAV